MADILGLYREIDRQSIILEPYPLHTTKSISFMDPSGDCYIGIDLAQLPTQAEEKVSLAHELGHCMTGSFYNRYSKLNNIRQKERRADTWAAQKIIPYEELEKAFQNGIVEIWELAEHFGVTEAFMEKTISVYEAKGRYHRPVCEE